MRKNWPAFFIAEFSESAAPFSCPSGSPLQFLSLFGSSARGEDTSDSDLDFVVEFETKSFDSYMDLKLFLEELFERPVDLVLVDGIKPRLRTAILREAIHAPGL